MKLGLVSVIVVGYNNWPDLKMAILSALHQSYQPVEVIVVDNDSSDETSLAVPRDFGGRVQYFRQDNRWDSGAYNTGFRHSEGEFIQFLDGDDVLAPGKIEEQILVFREQPGTEIVVGDVRKFQTEPGPARWRDLSTSESSDDLKDQLHPAGHGAGLSVLGSLFLRGAVEKIGPWDESLYTSDSDYFLRAAWLGCRFRHCPVSPMGFARRHAGQMTADPFAMMHGIEAVWVKALTYVDRDPHRQMILQNLARVRFYLAISQNRMSPPESLAKLRDARAACPDIVTLPIYFMGRLLIQAPGGRRVALSPRLRFLRRGAARLFGYPTQD